MLEIMTDSSELIKKIGSRSTLDNPEVISAVAEIMKDIRSDGDSALRKYTLMFDGCILDDFRVSESEIKEAYSGADSRLVNIIRESIENVRHYHEKQRQESWDWQKSDGMRLGQRISAIGTAGVYVPGGTAPLISSVIMNVVPAVVAGVRNIIVCTPPDKNGCVDPLRIVAAVESGATAIFKAGGAQAIFAMAFGTQSIPRADKITGPGNIYVANAKKLAFGYCGIDMIAGPSEILVIADSNANPAYVAADLLSQAEHDAMASAILITEDRMLADKVNDELRKQILMLSRKDTAQKSLAGFGAAYIADSREDAVRITNMIAPEHCELMVDDPEYYEERIENAGAIFIGAYSPEPLGDYWAGPNHTLPTGGTARFYSPLGVYDFYKRTSIIHFDRDSLEKDYEKIMDFAKAEGLDAHANAISIRFAEEEDD
ncbi:MAG: histidinol dehydrogenase [Clostridia bacterium]